MNGAEMAILVTTQYIENKGVDDGGNYWKFKGGDLFKVLGTDERPANAVALVAETLHNGPMGLIQDGFSVQVPWHWEVIDDDATPDNDWETFKVLTFKLEREH